MDVLANIYDMQVILYAKNLYANKEWLHPQRDGQGADKYLRLSGAKQEIADNRFYRFRPERQKLPETFINRAKSAERGSRNVIASDI